MLRITEISKSADAVTLKVVATFWRWLRYCGINQANSLVKLLALVRERVWWQVVYAYPIIHIDTTVETVYGDIEGARKGHNRKHRGKKACARSWRLSLKPKNILLANCAKARR